MTIINSTETIRLAREAIAWWEEQAEAQLKQHLFLKEPPFVQRARRVLADARLRYNVQPAVRISNTYLQTPNGALIFAEAKGEME